MCTKGAPPLPPPLLGRLEDVLTAEARAPGGRFAALDLQRVALLLGKYREVERASGFAAMHKSKQAEVRPAVWGLSSHVAAR